MPCECILKRIYSELLTLAEQGHDNFAKKIDFILTQYDVNKAEIPTSSQEEIIVFEMIFRETTYLQYINRLRINICQYPKLDFYRQIEKDYQVEQHILYFQNKNVQQALTKLRVSSHNLLIEQGRYSRPIIPRGKHICKFCSLNEIDTIKW